MRALLSILFLSTTFAACGSLPTFDSKKDKDSPSDDHAADAVPTAEDPDRDAALLAEIETAPVKACHESGHVYERRKIGCSVTILLATSFTCDRAGIREAFGETGYQIDVVLDKALGQEGNADDEGDGYSLDQCGESADGHLYVHFVKRAADGKVLVREIETIL